MKHCARIGRLLAGSEHCLATIENLRRAGYYVVCGRYETYVECDSKESAKLIECLNSNI